MYHDAIKHLDAAASMFHALGALAMKDRAHLLAGQFQQQLLAASPYPRTRRYLGPQWTWATGHIGLLYQLIRWFRLREPETQLVLLDGKSANPHFLQALSPWLRQINGPVHHDEVMHNAVYFGCPDGIHNLVSFNKMIEAECKDDEALALSTADALHVEMLQHTLGLVRPFVAIQARALTLDPARNVSVDEIEDALVEWKAKGYSVVSTGLDEHPINERYPSVLRLADPMRASFLLSACCDQFIGSNSGAWTIAHAYRRPVTILNDHMKSAWIYP